MGVAGWVGHRRLRAEMPCPRVTSLRIAFGPAFRVFLRKGKTGADTWTKLTARPGFLSTIINFVERRTLTRLYH